jgi:hypothetical protein
MWQGAFDAAWTPGEGKLSVVAGSMDEDVADKFRGPLVHLVLQNGGSVPNSGILATALQQDTISHCPEFGAGLYEKHKTALVHRILHRSVRAFGAEMPYDLAHTAAYHLAGFYEKNKAYEEALDALIIRGDMAITAQRSDKEIGFD